MRKKKPSNWETLLKYWEQGNMSTAETIRQAGLKRETFLTLLKDTDSNRPLTYAEYKAQQESALAECMSIEDTEERRQAIHATRMRYARILGEEITKDPTGEKFIYQLFREKASTSPFASTGNLEDLINAVGMTPREIVERPAMIRGMYRAIASTTKKGEDRKP